MKRLLLLGAGPAHLRTVRAFARERAAACDLQWLVPQGAWGCPARLAGWVAGQVADGAWQLPLAPLAAAAGATLTEGAVAALDLAQRRVTLTDGRTLDYDLLSLDAADHADRERLPGAREHALFAWPVAPFAALLPRLFEQAAERPLDLVVVGADKTAVQLAFAFEQRLRASGARVALVTGHAGPLPGAAPALVNTLLARLARRRITLVRERATRVDAHAVHVANGARLACDAPVVADAPGLPGWARASGLALGDEGLPRTLPTRQSVSHAEVFAAADEAAAEACGALLALNLRRAAGGGTLVAQALDTPAATWIAEGDRRAIAAWHGLATEGRLAGAWLARRQRTRFEKLAAA